MTSLKETFAFKSEEKQRLNSISDYEVFKDKNLLDTLRTRIVENIIDTYIPEDENIEDFINQEIDNVTEGLDLSTLERGHLYNLIDNEINGYGPLTELLEDDNISEIMVNSPKEIYLEIDGNIVKDESISFINDEHIVRTIQRLIEPMGRTIDASSPMVDSRLSDGSRINAVIPPISTKGPVITIRKFKESMNNINELIRVGSLTPYMAEFLEACVKSKLNIIICGGTGSGKTTLLNVLSSFIPENERIVTIEDAAELKLSQPDLVALETRTTNYDANEEITIRDLVRNSLRMRPNRIIVGEVRGAEAFDMLQVMNTGHEGSLTTLHANDSKDALHRLETMVMMGNVNLPVKAVREYIQSAINIVVNIDRLSDGKRKITRISEIVGFNEDEINLSDIFIFKQLGVTDKGDVDGEYVLLKGAPKCLNKIISYGFTNIKKMFNGKSKK